MNNQELIQNSYTQLINLGISFSSKEYMHHILSVINGDLRKKNETAKYVQLDPNGLIINPEVEKIQKEQVLEYIKAILHDIGVKMIYLKFKTDNNNPVISEMEKHGFKI